ncbi:type II secretion system F family protein [Stieleria sp. JC731]|uniref:type II secretion system F family protein n=1 Tax=Pirellulaceae TaxID=2691357 RepID=UPI001E410E40|nr:type II secretion system F family protein [Stieleria sp. JC731]MCC9600903.1 type II secretion system F family protein [Stieleria sp. JC731]
MSESKSPSESPALDDESFAMLLEEVTAMAGSGRPLVHAMADLEDRSLGRLGRAATSIRQKLEQGRSVAESISGLSNTYKIPVKTAFETMLRTGSVEPVRETVRLIHETNEDRRQARLAAINPIINAIVAAIVAFVVLPSIAISLSEGQLIQTRTAPRAEEILRSIATNYAITLAIVLSLFAVIIALTIWIYVRLNRERVFYQQHATFVRWIAIQICPGIISQPSKHVLLPGEASIARIVEAASTVIDRSFADRWSLVSKAIDAGASSNEMFSFPYGTPDPIRECIADLALGRRNHRAVAIDLRQLADLYTQQAKQHRRWWFDVVIRSLSILVMLGIALVMLQAIIMPIAELLKEVTR